MAQLKSLDSNLKKIPPILDELLEVAQRIDKDEFAKSWLAELYPKRRSLLQQVLTARELLENFIQQWNEALRQMEKK